MTLGNGKVSKMNELTNRALDAIVESIDLPSSGYEAAERRYKDLGAWFGRAESESARYSPHIYPQGSFRLGTVVRPLSEDGDYDLDLGCRLRAGISKATHTQEWLKMLVGRDLEAYRKARGIKNELEEKHRCWRLEYADHLKFHIDAVPSIPESSAERQLREQGMVKFGVERSLAQSVAALSGSITDNRSPNYRLISSDWRISNSEGYALWFESRIRLVGAWLQARVLGEKALKIDDLPSYRWQSPLQRVIQILKRHRDTMFESDSSSQPISIIITTLAAQAYQGEVSTSDAVRRVLSTMANSISSVSPRVPNPVNPAEDFADKWGDPSSRHLKLEENFRLWLRRAQEDFDAVWRLPVSRAVVRLNESFRTTVEPEAVGSVVAATGVGGLFRPAEISSNLSFPNKPVIPSKPAGFARGSRK